MSSPTHQDDDEHACDGPAPVWPLLLATGSVLLGYLVGRVSYRRDLAAALRRIEESSEPVELTIGTL